MNENNRPLRLLHITTVPTTLRFLRGQIGYLRDRGFQIHVLASPDPFLYRFAAEEKVSAHAIEMTRRISPLQDLRSLSRILSVIREIRPDIVHAHTPKGGLLGMLGAWLERVPVRIYHVHGLRFITAQGLTQTLLRLSEKFTCSSAHSVLCVSPSLHSQLTNERLCSRKKSRVLHNGSITGVPAETVFNPARYSASTREQIRQRYGIPAHVLVIGFVGRVVRDKGILELVTAWQQLREMHPETYLLIVGPIEAQDPVPEELVLILKNDNRVRFTGRVVQELPQLYLAMDLLVLPTYREGFGMVLIEAAAMELPVVATRIPGCVDAVRENLTGTLVPPHDAGALFTALDDYLRNPETRRQHGRAGREWVKRDFVPEQLWAAQLREYERLITARKSASWGRG